MVDELNNPDYADEPVYVIYRDSADRMYVTAGANAGTFNDYPSDDPSLYSIAASETGVGHFQVQRPAAVDAILNWSISWYFQAGAVPASGDDLIGVGSGSGGASAVPGANSYLDVGSSDSLAGTMLGLAAYKAASADDRSNALVMATERIDTAMRYQGRKYDLSQKLEFPRLAYGTGGVLPQSLQFPNPTTSVVPDEVWDWDLDNNVAIVPERVLRACLYEADSLLKGDRDARLDAAHDGLASQSVGGMSESYAAPVDASGRPVLCRQADELMRFYRLRTGSLR